MAASAEKVRIVPVEARAMLLGSDATRRPWHRADELDADDAVLPLARFLTSVPANRLVYGASNVPMLVEMRPATRVEPDRAPADKQSIAARLDCIMREHPTFGTQNYVAELWAEDDDAETQPILRVARAAPASSSAAAAAVSGWNQNE